MNTLTVHDVAGSWRCLVIVVLGLIALTPWRAQASDTIRCGSRLVSVGDLAAEVEARCGSPSYRNVENEVLPRGRGYAADVEIWTYNFGPNRLLQRLRFRDGRLVDISSDGYGFSGQPQDHCRPDEIVVGMSQYQLLFECGEPISKRAETVLAPDFRGGGIYRRPDGVYAYRGGYAREVYREHWVYNFGPSYFMRDVVLENGKVREVRDGKRGFNPP